MGRLTTPPSLQDRASLCARAAAGRHPKTLPQGRVEPVIVEQCGVNFDAIRLKKYVGGEATRPRLSASVGPVISVESSYDKAILHRNE